jgi:hypothetical protein
MKATMVLSLILAWTSRRICTMAGDNTNGADWLTAGAGAGAGAAFCAARDRVDSASPVAVMNQIERPNINVFIKHLIFI